MGGERLSPLISPFDLPDIAFDLTAVSVHRAKLAFYRRYSSFFYIHNISDFLHGFRQIINCFLPGLAKRLVH